MNFAVKDKRRNLKKKVTFEPAFYGFIYGLLVGSQAQDIRDRGIKKGFEDNWEEATASH